MLQTGAKKCNSTFEIPSYNDLLKTYKEGASSRNILWNITNEQFLGLIKERCHYCGSEPSIRKHDYSSVRIPVNGIDSIDSSKDYSIDNCVTCCTKCNYMKSGYSKEEFLEHIDKIYKWQEKEGSETISKESTFK